MELDPVFKALADPTRRALLDLLRDREGQTLFELHTRLSQIDGNTLTRQGLSRHLAILERAGLIRTNFEWKSKHHYLQSAPLERLTRIWLSRFLTSQQQQENTPA
ncbi:MAG: helix-turn-helix transcriptional regulator [Hyphomicrobiaceae bacterium]|nr:helix-turn-helix transcriptional regulator [Hyphomicrobiaceae bacterium]MCC0023320.1 helix-turn-helix transcriptional regulator [Hyphomicrobiaceae bacterium]